MPPRFATVTELLDHDAESPLAKSEFDDTLWLLISWRFSDPEDLAEYPEPVAVYFASRFLQWEVGNGGFAQAAYNIHHWFELAEVGYAKLGKPRAAQLVRDAIALLPAELLSLNQNGLLDGTTIERLFAHFRKSEMAALDVRIPEDEWWIDDERVDYVRKHHEAFRKIS